MVTIGERILKLRTELNLSQRELAKKTDITEATLSRYENNLREPKAEIIARISEILGCSTDYLLGQTDNKESCIDHKTSLGKNDKYLTYNKTEKKIIEILLDEEIIIEGEPVPQIVFDKVLKYGIEATIEILKLEKKLEE